MIAADWLNPNVDRPPLPRRERPPIFAEFADRFDSATLELPVVSVWPLEAPPETDVHPVLPRVADDSPTVEFRAVKPPLFSRRWWRTYLPRLVAGGASAVVLLVTGLGWIQ